MKTAIRYSYYVVFQGRVYGETRRKRDAASLLAWCKKTDKFAMIHRTERFRNRAHMISNRLEWNKANEEAVALYTAAVNAANAA